MLDHEGGVVEFNRVPSLVIVEAHRRACDESIDGHAAAKQRRLLLFVPYQRSDSDVPMVLSNLQRVAPSIARRSTLQHAARSCFVMASCPSPAGS
jgi:hypothetical protein